MEKKQWAVLQGKVDVNKDFSEIKYLYNYNSLNTNPSFSQHPQEAILKSNIVLEEGSIEFELNVKKPLNLNIGSMISCRFGILSNFFIGFEISNFHQGSFSFSRFINNSWIIEQSMVSKDSFQYDKNYKIRIMSLGSRVKFYIDDVEIISTTNCNFSSSPLTLYINANYINPLPPLPGTTTIPLPKEPVELIKISNLKYEIKKPKVFIVMQFTEKYNNLYNDIIKRVCDEFNLEPIRVDEIYSTSMIINDIKNQIENCKFVIAEITPDNPNVFFEVGFAFGIKKDIILICDSERPKLPFDVSGFRTLFYEDKITGRTKFENQLKEFFKNILGDI